MIKKMNLSLPLKIHPAVIAVWAAVVATAHVVPTVPMLGTGSNFSLSAVLSPLSGIFFGPIAGALCSATGGFVGNLVAPHTAWLGMGTFVIGMCTAFTAGCIAWGSWPLITLNRRGGFVINGGIIIYLIGFLLWFSQEAGRGMVFFPIVYYGIGFAALIAGSILTARFLASKNKALKLAILWLCAFGGMIGGASIGNFFFLVLYKMPKEFWGYVMIAAPVERAVYSVVAALIAAPLLAGLPKVGIFVGPQEDTDDDIPLPPQSD